MKQIWVFGFFCILLTLLFVSQNVYLQRKVELQGARSDSLASVQALSTDIGRHLFGLSQLFLGAHTVVDISAEGNEPHPPSIRQALVRLQKANPFLTTLLVLDETGRILHWTSEGDPPESRDREYFRVHQEGHYQGLFLSKPLPSRRFEGEYVFAVSQAFPDQRGDLEYVIVAIINLKYFQDNYASMELPRGNSIALVSPQGDLYMRMPGNTQLAGKRIPQIGDHLRRTDEDGFVQAVSPLDGKKRGISFLPVEGYPLIAAASYDEDIVLAVWREKSGPFVLFGLAASIFFLIFTLLAARIQRQQIRDKERLQQQATTDALTKLTNRRYAIESAHFEIKKAQRMGTALSFVLLDLDHFKQINDTFGHEGGDLVLQRVASVLSRFCRQTDTVSRFGGEEFLLILPGTDSCGAEANAEKIRKALADHFYEDFSEEARVTASFGVAQWQAGVEDFKDVLRRVDGALYQAKRKGRDCVQLALLKSDRPA